MIDEVGENKRDKKGKQRREFRLSKKKCVHSVLDTGLTVSLYLDLDIVYEGVNKTGCTSQAVCLQKYALQMFSKLLANLMLY